MKKIWQKIGVDYKYDFDICVELSGDDNLNNDLAQVVFSVINEFTKICPFPPPAGIRSIYVFYTPGGPITDSTTDINLYKIGLNIVDRDYAKLVYQLGHELCHVLTDPRRSNWFVESCCEMMSQLLLLRLSETWVNKPPFAHWVGYAQNFIKYAKNMAIKWRVDELGIDRPPNKNELIRIKDALQNNPCDRQKDGLIAEILLPFFKKDINNLHLLCFLGESSDTPPLSLKDWDSGFKIVFKWEKLEEIVQDDLNKLAREIKKCFYWN